MAAYKIEEEELRAEELAIRSKRDEEEKRLRAELKTKEIHIAHLYADKERKQVILKPSDRFRMVLDAYYQGWLSSILKYENDPEPCKEAKERFIENHFGSSSTEGLHQNS
jgi:hypothetical protein